MLLEEDAPRVAAVTAYYMMLRKNPAVQAMLQAKAIRDTELRHIAVMVTPFRHIRGE